MLELCPGSRRTRSLSREGRLRALNTNRVLATNALPTNNVQPISTDSAATPKSSILSTYEKTARNSSRMNTPQTLGLNPCGMSTYEKMAGGWGPTRRISSFQLQPALAPQRERLDIRRIGIHG